MRSQIGGRNKTLQPCNSRYLSGCRSVFITVGRFLAICLRNLQEYFAIGTLRFENATIFVCDGDVLCNATDICGTHILTMSFAGQLRAEFDPSCAML